MGISNVNNLNKIDLTKLGLLNKTKSAQSSKPEYMQMTGSIFNAPQVKNQTSTTNLTTLNTNRSFAELRSSNNSNTTTTITSSTKEKNSDSSVDQSSVQKQGDQVKSYTKTVEKDASTVRKFQSEGKELDKKTKDADKKYKAQVKREQANLEKDNAKLDKLVKENLEVQTKIEADQNELDSLLGSSSFTLSTGSAQGGTSVNPNQGKINELQARIGSNNKLVQNNGRQIYSLRRSSSRSLTRMNRTNANYIRTNKKNAKSIQQNQNETSKTINVATKIEQYSALAEQGGKLLDMMGQGLIAAGSAMGSFGAALIATGTVMSKIGTVVEMAGQYGQLAANVTKTVAYAAEGNLMGAMQSCAAAVQSGAAAAKSTKELKGTFGEIDKQAQDATKKSAANQIAKEEVKNMKANNADFGGLSEKDYRKDLSKKLQATEFGDAKDTGIKGNWSKTQRKEYLEQMKNGTNKDGANVLTAAKNEVTKEYNDNLNAQLKKAGFKDYKAENGKVYNEDNQEVSIDQLKGAGKKDDAKSLKKALKNTRKQTNSTFANQAAKSKMSKGRSFDFAGFSQGIMTTAMLFYGQDVSLMGGYSQYPMTGTTKTNKSHSTYNSHRTNTHMRTRRSSRASYV